MRRDRCERQNRFRIKRCGKNFSGVFKVQQYILWRSHTHRVAGQLFYDFSSARFLSVLGSGVIFVAFFNASATVALAETTCISPCGVPVASPRGSSFSKHLCQRISLASLPASDLKFSGFPISSPGLAFPGTSSYLALWALWPTHSIQNCEPLNGKEINSWTWQKWEDEGGGE